MRRASFLFTDLALDQRNEQIRIEPDEPTPVPVAAIAGFQGVLLVLTPMVTAITTTAFVAGQSPEYLTWAAFAAFLICGCTTALQAGRVWRFGTGHVLLTAASVSLVVVGVPALEAGGPGLLSALVVCGALAQFGLATWLPLVRRIITPVVTGTALMLLAATVIPIAAGRIADVPDGVTPSAGVVVGVVTLGVLVVLGLRVPGGWRLWAPLIAISAGSLAAAPFGLYELSSVINAPWVGLPGTWYPDFEIPALDSFAALLPMVVIVVLINGVKNMGDSVEVQRLSRREPRATDYRLVQGSLYANGLGVLLSGLAGSPPTTINSATSGALVSLTGVASRNVGYIAGATLVALAFSPKLTAVLLVIPAPVMGAYLLAVMGTYVVEGIRTVGQDGLDQKKALMVGISFSIGLAMNSSGILDRLPGSDWLQFLNNGLTAGTLAAVLMTWFLDLTGPQTKKVEAPLDDSALQEIDRFLRDIARKNGWSYQATQRLRAVGEETLWSLMPTGDAHLNGTSRRLTLVARTENDAVELEFAAKVESGNIQDQLAFLSDVSPKEDEASFRLLRHFAESVRHQKYHGVDVVKVKVVEGQGQVARPD